MGGRADEGLRRHGAFIALLSARDRWHTRAVALSRQPPGPLVTTEWVLTEVGDAFSQPGARQKFSRLLELLRAQPDVEIVPATSDLFRRGTALFAARPDKGWSLTDCVSSVVIDERGISDALTTVTVSRRLAFGFCSRIDRHSKKRL